MSNQFASVQQQMTTTEVDEPPKYGQNICGSITVWNKAAESLLGYTADEIIGRDCTSIMPDSFAPHWQRRIAAVQLRGIVQLDSVRKQKNGSLIDVAITCVRVNDRDGECQGFMTLMRDRRAEQATVAENLRLAEIVRSSPQAIVSFGTDGAIRSWNKAAEHLFGHVERQVIDCNSAILGADPEEAEQIATKLRAGQSVSTFGRRRRQDDSIVDVSLQATPLINGAGIATGWAVFYNDITAQLVAQKALERSEAFSRAIIETSEDWISVLTEEGNFIYSNSSRDSDYSSGLDKLTGRNWLSLWSDPHRGALARALGEIRTTGCSRLTAMRSAPDGRKLWYEIVMAILPGEAAPERRILVQARDVTARQLADDHIRLIVRELSHRAKNLLAVISAMARSTGEQSATIAEFETAFSARIQGLARSHDLLVSQDWVGASIRALIERQLHPFADLGNKRIILEVDDIILRPPIAQSLGMALHELATNAAKYGSLSNSTGQVRISCLPTGDGHQIEWLETGGPRVESTDRRGFGRVVVEELVSECLGRDTLTEFRPTGLRWSVSLPPQHYVSHVQQPKASR